MCLTMAKNSASVNTGANFFGIYSIHRIEDEYEVSSYETSYSSYNIDIWYTISYHETNNVMRQLLVPRTVKSSTVVKSGANFF